MVQRLLFSLPLCFVLSLSYACPVAVGTLSRVLYDGFFIYHHDWVAYLAGYPCAYACRVRHQKRAPLTFSVETIELLAARDCGFPRSDEAGVVSCPSCDFL
jgi:hypothetical protein